MISKVFLSFVAVGGLLTGLLLIAHYFWQLPSFESLERVPGPADIQIATIGSIDSKETILYFTFEDRICYYPNWFPRYEGLRLHLGSGEDVVVWTDRRFNYFVWQIERPGGLVVTYDEVRAAVAERIRYELYIANALICLGLMALAVLFDRARKRRNLQPAVAGVEDTAS